ncbi:hypothetical protein [Novacetimonas cocois]|uniref:hypothetical protein n=1 Tax=Novacetimonas cocois TaxID=1747507 RepID=UPI0014032634|nr:hypothetical protein [Novacetimonas cocois]
MTVVAADAMAVRPGHRHLRARAALSGDGAGRDPWRGGSVMATSHGDLWQRGTLINEHNCVLMW